LFSKFSRAILAPESTVKYIIMVNSRLYSTPRQSLCSRISGFNGTFPTTCHYGDLKPVFGNYAAAIRLFSSEEADCHSVTRRQLVQTRATTATIYTPKHIHPPTFSGVPASRAWLNAGQLVTCNPFDKGFSSALTQRKSRIIAPKAKSSAMTFATDLALAAATTTPPVRTKHMTDAKVLTKAAQIVFRLNKRTLSGMELG